MRHVERKQVGISNIEHLLCDLISTGFRARVCELVAGETIPSI